MKHLAPLSSTLIVLMSILTLPVTRAGAAPLGMYRFEDFGMRIGGFSLVKAKGTYHLFYTRGLAKAGQTWETHGNGIDLGHAMSRDLRNWNIAAPVLKVKPGTWDERSVWSPHIVELNNLFYLFYTGVNYAAAERIGLATSSDLLIWDRTDANPVWTPPDWSGFDAEKRSMGRDPSIISDASSYYMYYTAVRSKPDHSKPNVIAVAESTDLRDWKDRDYAIHSDANLESPAAFKRGGVYYLIAGATQSLAFRSTDPLDEWEPVEMDFPKGLSAFEIYQEGEAWFIAGIERKSGGDVIWISPLRWEGEKPIVVVP